MSNINPADAAASVDLGAVFAGIAHPAAMVANAIVNDFTVGLLVRMIVADPEHEDVRATLTQGSDFVEDVVRAVADQYKTQFVHPRGAHEALINEVRAADVSFNRALAKVQNVTSDDGVAVSAAARFAQFKLLLAAIRVIAIISVVGFDRAMAALPHKRGGKAGKGKSSRKPRGGQPIGKEHLVGDVANRVAALDEAIGTDRESEALAALDALRGTSADQDALVTKLMLMAHREPERIVTLARSLDATDGRQPMTATVMVEHAGRSPTDPSPVIVAEQQRFLGWLDAKGRGIAYLLAMDGEQVVFREAPHAPNIKSWAAQFTSTPEVQVKLRALHDEYQRNASDPQGSASSR